jgi:peptidoglycan hydrolase CwlO-like protein
MKKLICLLILSIFLVSTINVSAQTVYITKTGSKYHNDGCRYLSQSKISIDLATAISKGYGPCSVCKPPTQVTSSSNNKITNTNTEKTAVKQQINTSANKVNQSTNPVSQQCAAITKAGTRCTRKAEPGSIYCWQHKK